MSVAKYGNKNSSRTVAQTKNSGDKITFTRTQSHDYSYKYYQYEQPQNFNEPVRVLEAHCSGRITDKVTVTQTASRSNKNSYTERGLPSNSRAPAINYYDPGPGQRTHQGSSRRQGNNAYYY